MDKLLTPVELADYLRVTTATLAQDRYHRRGVPYVKHGNRVLYRASDIERYLETNMRATA
ncbi:helix-turn-helix domain-containing protein [Nocardia sp. CDC153]|uniref:helix-turn-helix domain-containing protein n=1 Tax=Nocardia sp. CDC153 TaxID=3112167 RepID=UPI002DB83F21|nr:helix-turn-helix domain-containing protein [Nocardia sp. CDC153]MEC3952515.1 helix-turn-helix domain-containing protein [Nocardia sp. CDC153]